MGEVRVHHRDGVAILELHSPVLSQQLLQELAGTLDSLARRAGDTPVVVASVHPRIFLAGAHLGEIARLDAQSSCAYAAAGRSVLARFARHPTPTVAAVGGSCAGGGLDLVLSCDRIVAGPRASLSHPGVRRGLVTGWGGTVVLPARIGASGSRRALLEGRGPTRSEAATAGLLRTADVDPVPAATAEARRLGTLHRSRLDLWRLLRTQGFVDTFRAFVVHNSM